MSRALRGDFARLRERGVASTLAPRDEAEPAAPLPVDRSPTVAGVEPDAEAGDSPGDVGAPQVGWLARLLGR